MKGKISISLLLLILIGSDSVFAQKIDSLKSNAWKTVEKGYKIQFPGNWTFDDSGKSGSTFFILSPKEDEKDEFRENVNLIIQDLGESGYDLKKFMELTEDQIKSLVPGSQILENTLLSGNKGNYQKLIWSGEMGGRKLKFEQFIYVHEKKAYILTLSVELLKWTQYGNIGESILKSYIPNF